MRRPAVLFLSVLAGAALAAAGPAVAATEAKPEPSAGESRLPPNGADRADALGDELGAVAAANGLEAAELEDILTEDRTARLDGTGRLHFVDPAPPSTAQSSGSPALDASSSGAPFPYSQTFQLHSRPGASRVLYLDFDGHSVAGTAWNSQYGVPAVTHPAWDLDGAPASFGNAERDAIQSIWQRVAEDYAPVDVDVTTEPPALDRIRRTSAGDTQYGTRVLISPSASASNAICGGLCGGVAYIGVFDEIEPNHSAYQPAWVFPQSLGQDTKLIAEAATHEAGHNLGLQHDGTSSAPYYLGHDIWAPIMGGGYGRPLTQWSTGEYLGANNTEDDLAVMQANGALLRADDHGDTTGGATGIGSGGVGATLTRTGVIGSRGDRDLFAFTTTCGTGTTTVAAWPAPTSPNLDVRLRVLSSTGTQLASINPPSAFVTEDQASGLGAATGLSLAAGNYFLEVDGFGARTPATDGYSDYGSLGAYSVFVRPCGDASTLAGTVREVDGTVVSNAIVEVAGPVAAAVRTNAAGAYNFGSLPPGGYALRVRGVCLTTEVTLVNLTTATTTNVAMREDLSRCTREPQAWIDAATVLPLTGDDASLQIALPFAYRHYGVDVTTAHVATNGFVTFGTPTSEYVNSAIPDPDPPNAAIYAFWDDLVVDASASVRTTTQGAAPNRRFVIEWRNVHLVAQPARRLSFEIVLPEDPNVRPLLQYRDIDISVPESGSSATVGRENAAGSAATQVSSNDGVLFDGLSIRPK